MLFWSGLLLFLGILAFFDSIYNYGSIFRQINSVIFMLISLGLLVRTATKIREGSIEGYINRIENLEESLREKKKEKALPN